MTGSEVLRLVAQRASDNTNEVFLGYREKVIAITRQNLHKHSKLRLFWPDNSYSQATCRDEPRARYQQLVRLSGNPYLSLRLRGTRLTAQQGPPCQRRSYDILRSRTKLVGKDKARIFVGLCPIYCSLWSQHLLAMPNYSAVSNKSVILGRCRGRTIRICWTTRRRSLVGRVVKCLPQPRIISPNKSHTAAIDH